MKTSSLSRLQKKVIGTKWILVCSVGIAKESGNTQRTMSLVRKTIFEQTAEVSFQYAFKKHWNNTRKNCLNVFLQTWDMSLHTGSTELHIFFATISTTFFSLTVFVSSRLVFFLIRTQICYWKMVFALMRFIYKKVVNALL